MKRIVLGVGALFVISVLAIALFRTHGSQASTEEGLLAAALGPDAGEAVVPAQFQGWGGHGGGRRGHFGESANLRLRLERLGLTATQKKRIADLRDAREREAIRIGSDLRLARLELRKQLREERPSQSAIDAQIDRLSALRAELMKSRIRTHLEIRSLLTAKQRAQLREMGPARGKRGDPSPERKSKRPDSRL